jgi:hypothetical protein
MTLKAALQTSGFHNVSTLWTETSIILRKTSLAICTVEFSPFQMTMAKLRLSVED